MADESPQTAILDTPVRLRWLPWTVCLAGFMASIFFWYGVRAYDSQKLRAQLNLDVSARAFALEREISIRLESIRLAAGFFATAPVDDDHFQRVVSSLLSNHPALTGVYWATPSIHDDSAQLHGASANLNEAQDDAGNAIELDKRGAAGPAIEHLRLLFGRCQQDRIWPDRYDLMEKRGMAGLLGDLCNSTAARLVTTTLPWHPASETLLLLTPVHETTDTPSSASLCGVLASVVRLDTMVDQAVELASLAERSDQQGIDLAVYWGDKKLYQFKSLIRDDPNPSGLSIPQHIAVAGEDWHVLCQPTDIYVNSFLSPVPWIGLVIGALCSWSASRYVRNLIYHHNQVESRVARRTRELRAANEALQVEMECGQRTEEALNEALAAYRSLLDSLPLNVFRKDLEGRIISANARFCETVNRPLSEVVGRTDHDLFPEEVAAKYQADDKRVIVTGEIWQDIEEHFPPDGRRIFVQVLKAPAIDAQGKIVGVQGMFWDVTERKINAEARKASDARSRQLVESNLIGVAIARADGEIFEANHAFLQMIGKSMADLGRLNWNDLTPQIWKDKDSRNIGLARQGGCRPWEKELWHADGSLVPVVAGVTWMAGPPEDLIWFVLDITERKQIETELHAAKEVADQANRAKTQFLANMSHEIRTPLNGVINLTQLVLDSKLSRKQREYLCMVRESGESLLSIVRDVLDFSKSEAGKVELMQAPFRFRDIVGDSLKSLAVRAHEKRLAVLCDIRADVPEVLIGDAIRFRQVLVNLVNNAIKFTATGEIEVSFERSSGNSTADQPAPSVDEVELMCRVRDTGIGIPREKQVAVFEAFEQADASMTSEYGGTGLGLAIVRSFVELMGGRIWVESETGRGSTFHFTVRFQVGSGPSLPPLPPAQVLIVNDHPTHCRILSDWLNEWNLESWTAIDADAAIQILDMESVDVVITDCQVASVDACDIARHAQSRPNASGLPPRVVVLSSSPLSDDSTSPDPLGVDAYLLQPFKHSELHHTLMQLLQSPSQTQVVDSHETSLEPLMNAANTTRRLKILIAEDSTVNVALMRGLLENHDLTVVGNGQLAVDQVNQQAFDVVLMDVRMPVMDGLEASRQIRERHPDLPIVAMTAQAMADDRQACLSAGMSDYLTKPLDPPKLHDMLETLAASLAAPPNARQGTDRDSAPSSTSTSATSTTTETPAWEHMGSQIDATPETESAAKHSPPMTAADGSEPLETLDWEAALEQVRGKASLLNELSELFAQEAPRLLDEADAARANGAVEEFRLAVHTLKGSLRYFGPTTAEKRAGELERMAIAGALAGADEKLADLRQRVEYILGCLVNYLKEC